MEKILLCVLLVTEWAFAFRVPNIPIIYQALTSPKQTSLLPRKGGLMLETPGSAVPATNTSVSNLAIRVNKLEKDREDEKRKAKHVTDLERKLENLLNDNKKKDIRLGDMKTAQEKLLNDTKNKDIRLRDLETVQEKLSNDNKNNNIRLRDLETAQEKLSSDNKNNDIRLKDLETAQENLLNDNKNKDIRLRDLETTQERKDTRVNDLVKKFESKTKRFNDLEKKFEKLLDDNENKDVHLDFIETVLAKLLNDTKNKDIRDMDTAQANLTSELNVGCGPPTPLEGTDVVYSSTGLNASANYTCKKGFLDIHPGQQMMSLCQNDGHWTMVTLMCVDISSCWTAPAGIVLYTGTVSTTTTGKDCQRWDSQTPHFHEYDDDAEFAVQGLDTPQTIAGSANYCRDPSSSGYLWCYTTDENERWEKCDVPKCVIDH